MDIDLLVTLLSPAGNNADNNNLYELLAGSGLVSVYTIPIPEDMPESTQEEKLHTNENLNPIELQPPTTPIEVSFMITPLLLLLLWFENS